MTHVHVSRYAVDCDGPVASENVANYEVAADLQYYVAVGFAVFCDSVMNCLVVLESVSTEPPLAVVWKRRPGIVVSIWRQLIFIVLGLVTAMLARFIPG